MILIGDFNVDFAKGTSKPLVDFLKTTLDLDTLNDRNESTIKYGTTIYVVFFLILNIIKFMSKIRLYVNFNMTKIILVFRVFLAKVLTAVTNFILTVHTVLISEMVT